MTKKQLKSWALFGLPVIVIVVLIGATASQPKPGEEVESLGNQHIASIDAPHDPYNTVPPTSGPHVGSVARWGVHTEQIPDELQVHNLEDGGVIVHYDPALEQETIDLLKDIVVNGPRHVILEPYAGMDAPIVLTAWGRIDKLESFDRERVEAFIDAYEGIDHHVR